MEVTKIITQNLGAGPFHNQDASGSHSETLQEDPVLDFKSEPLEAGSFSVALVLVFHYVFSFRFYSTIRMQKGGSLFDDENNKCLCNLFLALNLVILDIYGASVCRTHLLSVWSSMCALWNKYV